MVNELNFKGINDAYHVIDALFFIKFLMYLMQFIYLYLFNGMNYLNILTIL